MSKNLILIFGILVIWFVMIRGIKLSDNSNSENDKLSGDDKGTVAAGTGGAVTGSIGGIHKVMDSLERQYTL